MCSSFIMRMCNVLVGTEATADTSQYPGLNQVDNSASTLDQSTAWNLVVFDHDGKVTGKKLGLERLVGEITRKEPSAVVGACIW